MERPCDGRPARAHVLAVVLLVAGLAAAPAQAERSVEVYKARHRTAEALLPLARTALVERGNAVVDAGTNALVLMGEPGAVADALALLEQQDQALRTVLLRYESRRRAELEELGVRVAWSAGAGPFRIGNVSFPGGATGALVSPRARDAEHEGRFQGMLRVLEGQAGRIATGSSVPVTVGRGYWRTTTFATGESGFEAVPRVLGDGRVQVAFRPFEGSVDGRGRERFTDAETTVVVEPGETLAIGGLERDDASRDADAFGGGGSRRVQSETLLLLTVELEE